MKNFGCATALAALLGTTPLHAAADKGSTQHDTGIAVRQIGIGATLGMRIKLGSDRVINKSERTTFGIAAGPLMVVPDSKASDSVRRIQGSLVSLDFRPGFSTNLNFAGRPVLSEETRLGTAEDDGDKQSTGDKIGWVALVAGGVVATLIGVYALSCGPGEGSSCGSD